MSKPGRNDPCPCGSGKKYKHCCLLNPKPIVVETRMPELVNPAWTTDDWTTDELPPDFDSWLELDDDVTPTTPLQAAYILAMDGWAHEDRKRIKVAKEALAMSPDCIEAYLLWASAVRTPEEALSLYDQALAAAERDLGADWLLDYPVRLWTDSPAVEAAHDARRDRGRALMELGRVEEGIDLLKKAVVADPDDPDGTRYYLLQELLQRGREQEAIELINELPDAFGSVGLYIRALLKFRERGDTFWPRRAIVTALVYDAGTASVLAEAEPIPDLLGPASLLAFGMDADGTAEYLKPFWEETPGALDWLSAIFAAGPDANLDALPRGDGPALNVTLSDAEGYIRCPSCHRKTKQHQRDIVVMLEPDHVDIAPMTCRTCEQCDILCLRSNDLFNVAQSQATEHGLNLIANDFVPIGILDPSFHHQQFDSPEQQATAMTAAIHGWRDEIRPPSELDFPISPELGELDEILDLARATGLLDLLASAPSPIERQGPVKRRPKRR